jgi:integrating conjugative element protein (TIGR03759 family)
MKQPMVLTVALLIALPFPVLAQQAPITSSRVAESHVVQSQFDPSQDERLAREWGLRTEEFARYRQLMQGPLGIYSPNLDPLSALGMEARSDDERRRYAELQVQAESLRVEKLLAYQRAYDEAWQRLQPGSQRVNMPDASPGQAGSAISGSDRTAVFVRDNCQPCEQAVQRLQATGGTFDIYVVGSRGDDARIREWARRSKIDPARVLARTITLNHDGGRWLSLGLPGELPAVVRQVGGQWQRQP